MPVTRDTVRSTLPSLMRVFFGGQRIVEFVGTGQVSAEQADEMTSTVEYVFMRQNPGFKVCWSAWKDALVRKVGWVKWYWDDSTRISARVFDGVSEDQLQAAYATLEPDEELQVVSSTLIAPESAPDPATGAPGQPPQYEYKVRIVSRKKKGQVKVAAVPVEEVFVDRWATRIDDATVFGHRCYKRAGDLAAMDRENLPIDIGNVMPGLEITEILTNN